MSGGRGGRAARALRRGTWLALLLSIPLAQGAESGQRVHRCIGAQGEIVFSGLPCSAGATDASAGDPASAVTPAPGACAASRKELRDRVMTAIAQHDPNALAGLLRWRGVGNVDARLRTLRELVQRPLLAIDDDGEAGGDASTAPASETLRVRTGSGDAGVREQTFGVTVEGGCYWLGW